MGEVVVVDSPLLYTLILQAMKSNDEAGDISTQLWRLYELSDDIEQSAIDEAFCYLTGYPLYHFIELEGKTERTNH